MKYAVIRINKNQHKVVEGEELLVPKLGDTPETQVLMVVDGDKVQIGKPILKKAKVAFSVIDPEIKGRKITAATFKAKARFRKTKGIRPRFSKIKVGKITV